MRLDKLLAHSGFGTRKEVKQYIKKGLVSVNGKVVKKDSFHVETDKDKVVVDGIKIEYEEYVYYMLNKPAGYVSATRDNLYPTVVELIDDYYREDLFPVGRLDVDTEGLLLMTNDGQLAHRLLSPKNDCSKIYFAKIEGIVNENDIERFTKGIDLEDFKTKPAKLTILKTKEGITEVLVEIVEGKFHQIKRMFAAVQKEVIYLKRIQMKSLVLDEQLPLGAYRRLTEEEIYDLRGEKE